MSPLLGTCRITQICSFLALQRQCNSNRKKTLDGVVSSSLGRLGSPLHVFFQKAEFQYYVFCDILIKQIHIILIIQTYVWILQYPHVLPVIRFPPEIGNLLSWRKHHGHASRKSSSIALASRDQLRCGKEYLSILLLWSTSGISLVRL